MRRTSTLRFLAQPGDVNFGGKVHGGAVMKWIDQAGYSCAAAWSGAYCVTVYVSGIHFEHPIQVGEIVELRAQVVYTGRTSMHVAIDVRSSDVRSGAFERTAYCIMVFVALDASGRPKPVPKWTPETEHDRKLEAYAKRLMALRKNVEEELGELSLDPDPEGTEPPHQPVRGSLA